MRLLGYLPNRSRDYDLLQTCPVEFAVPTSLELSETAHEVEQRLAGADAGFERRLLSLESTIISLESTIIQRSLTIERECDHQWGCVQHELGEIKRELTQLDRRMNDLRSDLQGWLTTLCASAMAIVGLMVALFALLGSPGAPS